MDEVTKVKKRFRVEGPRVMAAAAGVFALLSLIGQTAEKLTPFKAGKTISALIGLIVLTVGFLLVRAAGPYQEEMESLTPRSIETGRQPR